MTTAARLADAVRDGITAPTTGDELITGVTVQDAASATVRIHRHTRSATVTVDVRGDVALLTLWGTETIFTRDEDPVYRRRPLHPDGEDDHMILGTLSDGRLPEDVMRRAVETVTRWVGPAETMASALADVRADAAYVRSHLYLGG